MTTRRRWTEEENAKLLETVELLINRGEKPATAHEICGALLDRTAGAIRNQYSFLTKDSSPNAAIEPVQEITLDLHPALHAVSRHIEAQETMNQELRTLVDSLRHENAKSEAEVNHLLSAINRSRTEAFDGVPARRDVRSMKRGEVWMADLGSYNGCEQGGERPVLIIQNDVGNHHSPTVIIAAITDGNKRTLLTHVPVERTGAMTKDSVVMLEQIRTVNKERLTKRIAVLPASDMKKVNTKILISFGISL